MPLLCLTFVCVCVQFLVLLFCLNEVGSPMVFVMVSFQLLQVETNFHIYHVCIIYASLVYL